MKVKEANEQRIVIVRTLGEKLFRGLFCRIFKVVIDKPTQSIVIHERYLWLIHRQHAVPFSAVMSVDVDYKWGKRGESPHLDGAGTWVSDWYWEKTWQLSLDVGSNKVEIDLTREYISQKGRIGRGTVETDMQVLARRIRTLIGTEQLLKRQKEATRAKDAAREEAVVSFKRRTEEAAKERKRQRH